MAITGLIRRLVKGSPLTAAEHDTNLDLLEAAIEGGTGDRVTSVAGKTGAVVLEAGDIDDFDEEAAVAAPVQSVAGKTGAVSLIIADITDISAAGRALIDDANVEDMRSTLGLSVVAASGDYADLGGIPSEFPPVSHAASHATAGGDPISPADIGAATSDHGHGWLNADGSVGFDSGVLASDGSGNVGVYTFTEAVVAGATGLTIAEGGIVESMIADWAVTGGKIAFDTVIPDHMSPQPTGPNQVPVSSGDSYWVWMDATATPTADAIARYDSNGDLTTTNYIWSSAGDNKIDMGQATTRTWTMPDASGTVAVSGTHFDALSVDAANGYTTQSGAAVFPQGIDAGSGQFAVDPSGNVNVYGETHFNNATYFNGNSNNFPYGAAFDSNVMMGANADVSLFSGRGVVWGFGSSPYLTADEGSNSIQIGNVTYVAVNAELQIGNTLSINNNANPLTFDCGSLSAPQTVSFPDATGTVVLDIDATSNPTANAVARFDGAGNIGTSTSVAFVATSSFLTTAAASPRTWTLPDADGTVVLADEMGVIVSPGYTSLFTFDQIAFFNYSGNAIGVPGSGAYWELPDASGMVVVSHPIAAAYVDEYGQLNSLGATAGLYHGSSGASIGIAADGFRISVSGLNGTIVPAGSARTYTLPDADGTVALHEDAAIARAKRAARLFMNANFR